MSRVTLIDNLDAVGKTLAAQVRTLTYELDELAKMENSFPRNQEVIAKFRTHLATMHLLLNQIANAEQRK